MEIVSASELSFPLFEYSKKGRYFYSVRSNDFAQATRLGMKNLKRQDLHVLDSSGKKLELLNFKKGSIAKPKISEIVFFDFRYKIEMEFKLIDRLSLSEFKVEVLQVLKVNRFSLESEGDAEKIMNEVQDASDYKEIIEIFY